MLRPDLNSFPSQPALPVQRRKVLQIGAGLFGLSLPEFLSAAAESGTAKSDMSCIFLFLAGGASHFETFDPKPLAPVEIRGQWNPTQTSVPGTIICEKLPLLAQRMDKVALIRAWQGKSGGHDIGSQHVTSGFFPPRGGQYFPNFGCLISALRGNRSEGVPAHFGLPVDARYTKPPGYLGPAFDAFNIKGDPRKPELRECRLNLPSERFDDRQSVLAQLENLNRLGETESGPFEAHDKFSREAMALLTGGAMARALNLDEEPQALRHRYGLNVYGQRVLLARRLIEAGARFVTVNQAVQGGLFGDGVTDGTWDNHHLLFDSMMSFANPPAGIPRAITGIVTTGRAIFHSSTCPCRRCSTTWPSAACWRRPWWW